MTVEIQREIVCRLTDRSSIFLRVDPPAEDSSPASWQRTGTAAEVLRLPALRAALCR